MTKKEDHQEKGREGSGWGAGSSATSRDEDVGGRQSAAWALDYKRRGWSPIPVPSGSKNPGSKSWQNDRHDETRIATVFVTNSNVGVLLGEPSGGLVDIDFDCPETLALASLLPQTGSVFGRPGNPASHHLYIAAGAKSKRFEDPTKRRKGVEADGGDSGTTAEEAGSPEGGKSKSALIELRSTGMQTVFPGSVHPSGESIDWVTDGQPAVVTSADLHHTVSVIASAALLGRHWPNEGARHDAALALAGGLLRAGWSDDQVEGFLGAVARAAGDEEPVDRMASVRTTRERLGSGEPATGWPKLVELVDERVIKAVCQWLQIKPRLQGVEAGASAAISAFRRALARRDTARRDEDEEALVRANRELDRLRVHFGLWRLLAEQLTYEQGESFARDVAGRLYRFANGVYRMDAQALVEAAVKATLEAWDMSGRWHARLSEEVCRYLLADAPALWQKPPADEINVLNGILNVVTRRLRPHEPSWLSTVSLPVAYDPQATCPANEAFMAAVYDPDDFAAGVPWELEAVYMLPKDSDQKADLFIGPPGTGKSTRLRRLGIFLGAPNTTALSLHNLEERFGKAGLLGKLANISPDLPTQRLETSKTFQAITGGDTLTGEFKFKNAFEFVPFCHLAFSTNAPPRSLDADDAFYDRWRPHSFTQRFRGTNQEVPQSLLLETLTAPGELSGVLNKALDALQRVRAQGGMTVTKSMQAALAEIRAVTDPLNAWFARRVVEQPGGVVAKEELLRAHNADAEADRRPVMTATAFGLAVKGRFPRVTEGQRKIGDKSRVHCYIGIVLQQPGQ